MYLHERTCLACGVLFSAFRAKTKYCSRHCGYRGRRKNPPFLGGSLTCVICGTLFVTKKYAKFCSPACRARQYRILAIVKLGGKCAKCGYTEDWRALHLDHIYGGGAKERKKISGIGFYKMVLTDKKGLYQLLCANCHYIKTLEHCTLDLKFCQGFLASKTASN